MPSPVPHFDKTPGHIEHLGVDLGKHNEEVLIGELGLTRAEYEEATKVDEAGSQNRSANEKNADGSIS